jgi:hypothetical protein
VIAEASGEILYTVRARGARFQPPVYAPGSYTVRVGRHRPDGPSLTGLRATSLAAAGTRTLKI